jgi:hypothetical protein
VLAAARAEAGPPVRPLAVVPGAGRGDVPGPSRPARGHRRRPLIATGGFAAAVVVGIGLVVARGVVATRAEPPATPAVALAQQADRVVADARSRDPGLRAAVLRTGTGDPAAVVLDPGDAAAPLRLLPLALPPAGTAGDYVVWAVGLPGDVPVAVAVMDPDEGLTRPLAVTAAPSAPGAPEARGWAVSVEADGPAPARPSAVVAVGLAVA